MEHDHDAERLLRASRPEPSHSFVRDLEGRLQRPARRAWLPAWRPVVVGAGLASLLATVALAISLAGLGPFASSTGDSVQADDTCTTVMVERTERKPVLVTGADGKDRIEYRERKVRRPVTRCE
jgi:hypothetical protein